MARFLSIICLIFIFVSCGQIGSISGGPKDEIAPKVSSSNLKDKQTNFTGQEIQFTFDEYIELNKPSEQIVLVPADSKFQSKLANKTLFITFDDALQQQTTYTLYLNAAVKDVTEGNDSLMKYTFSTGNFIDSLSLNVKVFDAYSKEFVPKVTVGLFSSLEDENPRYFTQSQSDGLAHFDALKQGNYFLKAFSDKNQDLHIQTSEQQGYLWEVISVGTRSADTLLVPMSFPIQTDQLKNARLIPPGIIGVHVPSDMDRTNIQLNGQPRDINQVIGRGTDSLLIAIGEMKETDLQLIIASDTVHLRYTPKQQAAKNTIQMIEKEGLKDRIYFTCSDFIQWIDTNKIKLQNLEDSSFIKFEMDYLANEFEIRPLTFAKNLQISIAEGAIIGKTSNASVKLQKEINWKVDRDFGDLNMRLSDTLSAGIVEVLQKNQLIRVLNFSNTNQVSIANLLPGEYTFKIICDANGNGKWDPVSVKNKTNPEEVLLFNSPIKIRANWEIESTFDIQPFDNNKH